MVTLTSFPTLQEAFMFQSYLQGSGIESFIPDECCIQNFGVITAFGGEIDGVRLQVTEEDILTAKDLLDNFRLP